MGDYLYTAALEHKVSELEEQNSKLKSLLKTAVEDLKNVSFCSICVNDTDNNDKCKKCKAVDQLKSELADYVHWFNNSRIHGSLGYPSPVQFKKSHLAK